MKKKIAILGSTGSIGTTSLNIFEKKNNSFKIEVLSANKNYNKILYQIKKFKPNFFVVTNNDIYLKIKKKFKNNKIKIVNSFKALSFSKKKIDITIAAIPGLIGLEPTIKFTKISKKILLANKEAIICGWDIIKKTANKNNTKIVPLDSEHFSIYKLVENYEDKDIDRIYITASGGPFLNLAKKKFKNIKPSEALKHPKWSMGKKISIDSATLMNKVLELIEAQKIFNFDKKKYHIIIHPQSLVHAIVKFKNGITKLLYHEPNMMIPIANAIFDSNFKINNFSKSKNSNNGIVDLNFQKVDAKRFPIIKIIPKLNQYQSTPIIINAVNEILIDHFLKRKISFNSISKYLFKVLKDKNYKKYAIKNSKNLKNIYIIDQWSRGKILEILKRK